ncbi:MAG: SMP-30/gluconolactonase/LRE family protein [Myxococcales bacterium]
MPPLPPAPHLCRSLSLPLCLLVAGCCAAVRPSGASGTPAVAAGVISAPAFPGAGPITALSSDIPFVSLEGPFWSATGGYLLFSDVVEANGPGAGIYKFDPATSRFSVFPYPAAATTTGLTSTNGLAVDAAGAVLACERYNARLVRVDAAGKLTVLADGWPPRDRNTTAPRPFNAPNDLVVRSDLNIYFTDSDWGARPGVAHAGMAVYRISPTGRLERIMELEKPNGIALSPDEKTLYVGSDVQAKVWRVQLDAQGAPAPGPPRLFIDGTRVPGGFKVPDGICVDDTGNLYITNNADDVKAILVFDPTGQSRGRIAIPQAPSNCTFGGPDRRTMYVTTLHAVYQVRMSVPGLP